MSELWANKTVIVTGGGSGIGSAVAHRFAREGANVAVVGRTAQKVEQVAADIAASGGSAVAIAADVSSEEDARKIVAETIRAFGALHVLVNNAAVCPQIRLTDMSLEEWNRVITNNLTSVFLLTREAVPHLIASGRGGAVVNVASVHAVATLDGYSAYAASKGGIVALTRAIALDFARDGIRANCVLPGAVRTPMLESSVKNLDTPREEIMKTWNESQPIGRVGEPEEIATAVLFAASPDNSFMTGASIVVDGGMTADL